MDSCSNYVFDIILFKLENLLFNIFNLDNNNFTEFQNLYTHPAPRTLAEAGYIVDSHLFLPYDMHTQPFVKQKYDYPVQEGQFDDVEDS